MWRWLQSFRSKRSEPASRGAFDEFGAQGLSAQAKADIERPARGQGLGRLRFSGDRPALVRIDQLWHVVQRRTPVGSTVARNAAMSGWTPDPKSLLEPGETWRSTLFDDVPVPTFHEELYRTAQAAGPSSEAIDAVLDAHRREHGEPEQVAYAARLDPCDERFGPPPPQELEKLLEKFGQDAGQRLSEYLREHHAWKQAPSSMRQT